MTDIRSYDFEETPSNNLNFQFEILANMKIPGFELHVDDAWYTKTPMPTHYDSYYGKTNFLFQFEHEQARLWLKGIGSSGGEKLVAIEFNNPWIGPVQTHQYGTDGSIIGLDVWSGTIFNANLLVQVLRVPDDYYGNGLYKNIRIAITDQGKIPPWSPNEDN